MSAFVALSVVLVFSLLLLYFGQVMLFNQQQSAHFEYFLSTFNRGKGWGLNTTFCQKSTTFIFCWLFDPETFKTCKNTINLWNLALSPETAATFLSSSLFYPNPYLSMQPCWCQKKVRKLILCFFCTSSLIFKAISIEYRVLKVVILAVGVILLDYSSQVKSKIDGRIFLDAKRPLHTDLLVVLPSVIAARTLRFIATRRTCFFSFLSFYRQPSILAKPWCQTWQAMEKVGYCHSILLFYVNHYLF